MLVISSYPCKQPGKSCHMVWHFIVEAGQDHPESLVFLHGWPEDWTGWQRVMEQACKMHHVVAFDLPGVGESRGAVPGGEKAALAESIHQAIQILGLNSYVIVGHDAEAIMKISFPSLAGIIHSYRAMCRREIIPCGRER